MKHEESTKFVSPREEVERYEAAIKAIEEKVDYYGPIELSGLPEEFKCTRQREDEVTDRYVFSDKGMELVLLHQRNDNTIVEPFPQSHESNLDPQIATIQQIEDGFIKECKSALVLYLSKD